MHTLSKGWQEKNLLGSSHVNFPKGETKVCKKKIKRGTSKLGNSIKIGTSNLAWSLAIKSKV